MNGPWGISGPAFAWLYGACVVLPAALAVVYELWLRRDTGARKVSGLYHLAALAGGTERVTDTAVAGLLERHRLRPDGRGLLHPIRPVPADPFERALVTLVHGNGIGLGELRARMARHPVVLLLRTELAQNGLSVSENRRRTGWQCALAAYVAVLALGIARLANAVPLERPTTVLVVLIVCAVGALGLTVWRQRPDRSGRATTAGKLALHHGDWDRDLARTTTGRVALDGLQVFPDQAVALTLIKTVATKGRLFGGTASTGGGGVSYAPVYSCGGGGVSCGGGGCGG